MSQQDIREIVPRVRRALDVDAGVLTDDQVKDQVADALGDLILYTGSAFGRRLLVTASDPDTNAPTEYAVDPALGLPEQSAVAMQAALNWFFHQFADVRISEAIKDEAQEWDVTRSAQLYQQRFKMLIDNRDRALEAIQAHGAPLDQYISLVQARDRYVSALVEPWVNGGQLLSGQEDYRFGTAF